ncbi:MAG: septum site-determining protein MinC [Rhodoferax sp.]
MLALVVKHGDMAALAQALLAEHGPGSPGEGFFDNDAVVIDLGRVDAPQDWAGLEPVIRALGDCGLKPVALHCRSAALMQRAQAAGWLAVPDPTRATTQSAGSHARPAPASAEPVAQPSVVEVVREVTVSRPSLVVDKPVRSGQKVYARGGDLVVTAMVNPGAEVIADGHIHVYAALRGKALAGASGDVGARIFALGLEPEMVAIAGVFRTAENPLPPEVRGRAASVRLRSDGQEQLIFEALSR